MHAFPYPGARWWLGLLSLAIAASQAGGEENVALGRAVTVSSEPQAENGAGNLVDGESSNRWSADGFPQWAEIDLGAEHDLTRFELVPHMDRAYQYTVEARSEGGSWETVVDRSANTTGGSLLADPLDVSTRFMGAQRIWDHDPFFDYAERYMEITGGGSGTNGVPTFVQQMWALYSEDFAVFSYNDFLLTRFTPLEIADYSVTGRDADPDGDGVANFEEYFFGTDPRVFSPRPLPTAWPQGGERHLHRAGDIPEGNRGHLLPVEATVAAPGQAGAPRKGAFRIPPTPAIPRRRPPAGCRDV